MALALQDFAGDWSLMRRIAQADGGTGVLRGTARFALTGPVLDYSETGVLTMDGAELEARQSHVWRTDGNRIHVCFSDGRPFHSFELGVSDPAATHDCPPDTYVVTDDFGDWPEWHSRWVVTGPRKDYRMVSTYTRIDSQP